MKAPVKYIIIGKFTRDTNGNPCMSLSKDDLAYIDMDKEYAIIIDGPIADVSHKEIRNNGKTKTVIRCMSGNASLFIQS